MKKLGGQISGCTSIKLMPYVKPKTLSDYVTKCIFQDCFAELEEGVRNDLIPDIIFNNVNILR